MPSLLVQDRTCRRFLLFVVSILFLHPSLGDVMASIEFERVMFGCETTVQSCGLDMDNPTDMNINGTKQNWVGDIILDIM